MKHARPHMQQVEHSAHNMPAIENNGTELPIQNSLMRPDPTGEYSNPQNSSQEMNM